jgi:hypothetical protein
MARFSVFWVVTAVSVQHIGFSLQGCPETTINNYRQTPYNNQRPHLHRSGTQMYCMNTKSRRNERWSKLAGVLHGRNPLIWHFMIPGGSETKKLHFSPQSEVLGFHNLEKEKSFVR